MLQRKQRPSGHLLLSTEITRDKRASGLDPTHPEGNSPVGLNSPGPDQKPPSALSFSPPDPRHPWGHSPSRTCLFSGFQNPVQTHHRRTPHSSTPRCSVTARKAWPTALGQNRVRRPQHTSHLTPVLPQVWGIPCLPCFHPRSESMSQSRASFPRCNPLYVHTHMLVHKEDAAKFWPGLRG